MTFCVECGIDCEETIHGMCIDCFLNGRQLTTLPHHVDLQVCANCGEFYIHEFWVKKDRIEAVEDAAIENLSAIKEARVVEVGASSVEQDNANYLVNVDAELDISGYSAEYSVSTVVRVKNTVCKRCSRQLGSYYESILQIRTADKDLSPALQDESLEKVENFVDQQAKTNRQIFITKMEIVTGGVDVYLSSIALGKALSKMLADTYCAEMKEASKLVGQTDDGQDMYRVTYLVRLPDYHVGDVILFEKRYFVLTRVANSGGKMIDLQNFKERAIKRTDLPTVKVHQKHSDLRDATVISRSEGEIQVLHPLNYSTIDLRVPTDIEISDVVKVCEIDDVLYYVPQ